MNRVKLFNRVIAVAWLIAGGSMAYGQLMDGYYFSVTIIFLSVASLFVGLWNAKRWAAQASTFLLLIINIIAIFFCFPPFESDGTSLDARIIAFIGISAVCIGVSFGLYLSQKKIKI